MSIGREQLYVFPSFSIIHPLGELPPTPFTRLVGFDVLISAIEGFTALPVGSDNYDDARPSSVGGERKMERV